jgi:hypothetical protein
MHRFRFRIRTAMIAVLGVAAYLFMWRMLAELFGYHLSAGRDTRGVPAVIGRFSSGREYSVPIDKIAVWFAANLAAVLVGVTFRRAIRRMILRRRDKLDQQFAMRERADSEFGGDIRRLAEFTGSVTAQRTGRKRGGRESVG